MEVERLYLPSLEDEYGVKDKICAIAAQKGIETVFVEDVESLTLGGATLRVYPPVGKKNQNEAGLTALCSAGSFDVLVTGDMPANTEKKLIADYDLPRVEVLLVGTTGRNTAPARSFCAPCSRNTPSSALAATATATRRPRPSGGSRTRARRYTGRMSRERS